MAKKRPGARRPAKGKVAEPPKIYEHTEEKLLLRPDVGLQPQFKAKKPPKTYRYDPSLDPALSWDTHADRERGEALIAGIEQAKDLAEARAAAAELKRMSRPFLNWAATPGTAALPPKVHHVYALSPERDSLEIRFPRVEGYLHRISADLRVAWERVPVMTLDPLEIPDEVRVKAMAGEGGRPSLLGPGAADDVTLEPWRQGKRLQELEFELARALTKRVGDNPSCQVPANALFPKLLAIVRRFVSEKVQPLGRKDRKDVFLDPYWAWAIEALAGAIEPGDADSTELPRYEAHRGDGSTRDVDFWTSKPVRECERSHLNYVVADTEKWEQSAAFYLDTDQHVVAFVKNFNLGFAIPYAFKGDTREYLPDFLVRVRKDGREVGTLILETKGYDPLKTAKIAGAQRWVQAVNTEGSAGRWAYRIVSDPAIVPAALESAASELANPPRADWRAALRDFTARLREVYGPRLSRVLLYGSRARGDAEWDSDVDVLVVLDPCEDFWAEMDRVSTIAGEILVDHGVVLSVMPASIKELEDSEKPIFRNVRREGVAIP